MRRTIWVVLLAWGTQAGLRALEAPTCLQAAPKSASEIILTWVDNATGESGFVIERCVDNRHYLPVGTAGPNVTSFVDGGLLPNQLYLYRVKATGDLGNSRYSNWNYTVTRTTVKAAEAPTAPVAAWIPGGGALVWWRENFSNETGFEIERSVNGGAFALAGSVGPNVTTWTDPAANLADTTYTYRLRAKTASAASGYSKSAAWHLYLQGWPGEPEAYLPQGLKSSATLTPPSHLTATPVTTSRIDLQWKDNSSNETGFHVLYSTDQVHFEWLATVGPNVKTFNHLGAIYEVTYHYRVAAAGLSATNQPLFSALAPSAVASAQTRPFNPALPAPSGLTAVEQTGGGVALSWQDHSSNETGFAIERTAYGGIFRFTRIATVGSNVRSFFDPDGVAYMRYRVQALHAAGDSAYSAPIQVEKDVAPPTLVVQNLAASAVSATQINLTWTDTAELNVQLERSVDNGPFSPLAIPQANSFQDRSVLPGSTYRYRMVVLGRGDQPYSTTVTATPPGYAAAPAAPAGVTATGVSTTQINLKWSVLDPAATSVTVERSSNGGASFAAIATLGRDARHHSDAGLPAGASRVYRLRAANPLGNSAYSASASAATLASNPTLTATVHSYEQHRRLTIRGTAAKDSLRVWQSGVNILVSLNGGAAISYAGPFGELAVHGGDGNDQIKVEGSVSVEQVQVYGGAGDDVLEALGSGKQTLVSVGGGRDICTGNGIDSSYWADQEGVDTVNASPAETAAYRVHRVTAFYQPFTFDPLNSKYVSKELEGQSWPEQGLYAIQSGGKLMRFPNNSLWGRGPVLFDVNQGFWSNCGALAPAQAYADMYPRRLQESAADLGDGTFAVRVGSLTAHTYARVDGDFMPGYGSYVGRNGNLWWLLLEKMFTSLSLDPFEPEPGFERYWINLHGDGQAVYAALREALDRGRVVLCGTVAERHLDAPGVYHGHAYSLAEVYKDPAGEPYFIIKNPYGILGFHKTPDPQQGLLTVNLKQFQNNFGGGAVDGYVVKEDNLPPAILSAPWANPNPVAAE